MASLKPKQQAGEPLAASRRRWFRAIAIAMPFFTFVVLELILRAVGFGYPTGFFLQTRVNGNPVFIENQEFSRRYFPPGLERVSQPLMFRAAKPTNTVRLFVFGESAAMGDPEPAFGFARMLEVLLREAMPGRNIEVINVAVTAINSHVVREIAKDCADKQGDFWLVYMGHNEVVGPFGAGTIFGAPASSLTLTRAGLAIKTTRLGQLLDSVLNRFGRRRGPGAPAQWAGMEMFMEQQVTEDDPRLAKVYKHFQTNLRDIIQTGEASGAKVVVSTVASNLKDCAPFASRHRVGLTAAQLAEWEKRYHAAMAYDKAANFQAAVVEYQRAAELDDHAELHFRLGRCHRELGEFQKARMSLERARDLDTLRFRADGKINQIIGETAAGRSNVSFLDVVGLIATNSPDGLAGEEFFFEHVHLNFAGNYLIARAMARHILGELTNVPAFLTSDECAHRLAYTEFNRFRLLDEVRQRLQQPPFTAQLDHEQREDRLQQQLARLDQASLGDAVQLYRQAIGRAPDDWVLRENFATLLQDFGQSRAAEEHWRKLMQLLPHYDEAYLGLGKALEAQGRTNEAAVYFRRLLPD
jgi:tetratricopeptide (TPR) repeat protein